MQQTISRGGIKRKARNTLIGMLATATGLLPTPGHAQSNYDPGTKTYSKSAVAKPPEKPGKQVYSSAEILTLKNNQNNPVKNEKQHPRFAEVRIELRQVDENTYQLNYGVSPRGFWSETETHPTIDNRAFITRAYLITNLEAELIETEQTIITDSGPAPIRAVPFEDAKKAQKNIETGKSIIKKGGNKLIPKLGDSFEKATEFAAENTEDSTLKKLKSLNPWEKIEVVPRYVVDEYFIKPRNNWSRGIAWGETGRRITLHYSNLDPDISSIFLNLRLQDGYEGWAEIGEFIFMDAEKNTLGKRNGNILSLDSMSPKAREIITKRNKEMVKREREAMINLAREKQRKMDARRKDWDGVSEMDKKLRKYLEEKGVKDEDRVITIRGKREPKEYATRTPQEAREAEERSKKHEELMRIRWKYQHKHTKEEEKLQRLNPDLDSEERFDIVKEKLKKEYREEVIKKGLEETAKNMGWF